jgi:YVTN family beta-propeller protein
MKIINLKSGFQTACLLLPLGLLGCRHAAPPSTSEPVGSTYLNSDQRVVLPVSQILTPAGKQVHLPGMRPQGLALSPNGHLLVTSGKSNQLVVVHPVSGAILQSVPLPTEKVTEPPAETVSTHILEPDTKGQLSFTGLIFSPDGRRIFLSNVNGSIKVFAVDEQDHVRGLYSIPLPKTSLRQRAEDIPSGLGLSPDGRRLYVVLNLSNRLLELDLATRKPLRTFDVGVAPYDVVLAGHKAYVSNWGGRRPDPKSVTGPAGQGTRVRVDPARFIANEGTVSVIDLESGATKEIMVGLHACALALHPSGRYLVVANAASDTLSVLDTRTDAVVETISLKWQPTDYFGASPNALAFEPAGKTLYVCNGTHNAVAVVGFEPGNQVGRAVPASRSKLLGLIPVGWFPGAVVYDAPHRLLQVANIKGIGSGRRTLPGEVQKMNSHQYYGTLSLVPVPGSKQLAEHTRQVLANCRRDLIEAAQLPPRPGQPACPVPERAGEPSVFKHVVYIIKENRTYDQVLGDMKEGNGAASLCTFGERITPNQHKMAREFVLLDNTYCSGILSADGHQWADSAFATDYMERSFAGFPRSYPDGMEDSDVDALAYSPAGFIWDSAIEHGKTLRDYGEFTIGRAVWKNPKRKPAPKFIDFYRDFTGQTGLVTIDCRPAIESLRPYLNTNTVGWDMRVPDVFRAAQFIRELQEFDRAGSLPELILICLPNDHTSGTKAGFPTPAAQVADNDLAFGQIVEALSHSRFWKETCIFAIEDDPQSGWDHVSAFRTTAYVISPYTKRHAVIHTQYNQPGLLRTMELMLGLPPLNQMDAAATPMFDCFTDQPDFTPYTVVTNNIPLDQMNPEPRAIRDPLQRRYAELSARLPLDQVDRCPEDLLNRILWHAMKGSDAPYPTTQR